MHIVEGGQAKATAQDPNRSAGTATVKRSYSSASSLGVLAADELESEIKLTKFSPISSELAHVITVTRDGQSQVEHQQVDTSEPKRAHKTSSRVLHLGALGDSTAHQQLMIINKPEYGNERALESVGQNVHKPLGTLDGVAGYRQLEYSVIDDLKGGLRQAGVASLGDGSREKSLIQHQRQEFKVIWRSLSFEVETSAYDKFINSAFDGINGLLKMARFSSSASKQQSKQEQVSSTCQLAQLEQAQFYSDDSLPQRSQVSNSKRVVFENLNGCIRSGQISAILGPSGAGKTSLLTALCGGKLTNYRGSIQLVGGDPNRRMQLSIIPQKDYLIENLTVRENLHYSSQLLNTEKNFNHEAKIMRVVKMLNLSHCFDSPASNISGGEYKRVSIAQELLRQPDILILDEPTSGLDSLNCKKLVRTLKQLIETSERVYKKPIAVVMTIHQPDIDVYNLFDHVYCMARGGRVIFDGKPADTMQHLRSFSGFIPGDPNAPPELSSDHVQANPANLLIEIASEDLYGQEPIDRLARFQRKQFEQLYGSSGSSSSGDEDMLNHESESYSTSKTPALLSADQLGKNLIISQTNTLPAEVAQSGLEYDQPSTCSSSSSSSPTSTLSQRKNYNNNNNEGAYDAHVEVIKHDNQVCKPVDSKSRAKKSPSKSLKRDKRLKAKHDHEGKFWYHTGLLTRRAFISTLRDPLMSIISLSFHLTIPFVMWTVYPRRVGRINACPVIQRDMDIVSMASNKTLSKMSEMQADMMSTFECSTMLFVTVYALSMCSLAVAALAFPLSMHVLLKEVRNGWYDLKAFVLAKQLACFPFEVIFPSITMIMIYIMLDMPSSPYEWRLWSIALVMAAIAVISNTHGLTIGALCMDSVQTSVFLSIASTLPQILLSGFTARLKYMPALLRHLSWLSLYRYSTDLMYVIRYGFGTCPCDDETDEYLRTKKPQFTDLPENLKSTFLYYISTVDSATSENQANATLVGESNSTSLISSNETLVNSSYSLLDNTRKFIPGLSTDIMLSPSERSSLLAKMESNEIDIFGQLAESMSRALTYGRDISSCKSVRSQLLELSGIDAEEIFFTTAAALLGVLCFFKIMLFVAVKYKIGSQV